MPVADQCSDLREEISVLRTFIEAALDRYERGDNALLDAYITSIQTQPDRDAGETLAKRVV